MLPKALPIGIWGLGKQFMRRRHFTMSTVTKSAASAKVKSQNGSIDVDSQAANASNANLAASEVVSSAIGQSTGTGETVKDAAQEIAAQRKAMLETVTFQEAFTLSLNSARWSDIVAACKRFAPFTVEAAKSVSDGKPSAIARKAGAVAPRIAFELRTALLSYSFAGRKMNSIQEGELGQLLPLLKQDGKLGNAKVTFGGIVLPPLVGDE